MAFQMYKMGLFLLIISIIFTNLLLPKSCINKTLFKCKKILGNFFEKEFGPILFN